MWNARVALGGYSDRWQWRRVVSRLFAPVSIARSRFLTKAIRSAFAAVHRFNKSVAAPDDGNVGQHVIEQLDPVPNRSIGRRGEMRDAADVR
jgi:hypothetical protein